MQRLRFLQVTVSLGNNDMKNEEKFGKGVKFERIRRITGYLSGSMETWNNAKKAEARDRVKHGLKTK